MGRLRFLDKADDSGTYPPQIAGDEYRRVQFKKYYESISLHFLPSIILLQQLFLFHSYLTLSLSADLTHLNLAHTTFPTPTRIQRSSKLNCGKSRA